jgi:RNA polymerase sigma factor (sigma-70 family)
MSKELPMSTTSFPEKIGRELCDTLNCDPSQVNVMMIYHIIKSWLYSWDLADTTVEDILGRVCIECRKAVSQQTEIKHPTAWLIQVARCQTIDELEKKEKNKNTIYDSELVDKAVSERAYEAMAEDEIQHPELGNAMKKLKPLDQKIIQLHMIAGYKFDEIAQMLKDDGDGDHTPEALRKRQSRAIEKLKRNLAA